MQELLRLVAALTAMQIVYQVFRIVLEAWDKLSNPGIIATGILMLPLSLLVSISLLALLDNSSWPLYTLIVVVVNIGSFFNWGFNDTHKA